MPIANGNILLVEGKDEQFTLPFLMDEYIVWGKRGQWAVEIKELGGVENLLKPGVIEAESKVPGLRALGVIIDADDHFAARWIRVRERCRKVPGAREFPEHLPAEGAIYQTSAGLRIGVWIMPDNQSRGMLETFLSYLLIPERLPLWDYATEACEHASRLEGSHSLAHRDKAMVHTYLAWIEPPGLTLPHSVLEHAFDARLPLAGQFVRWFIDLYQLMPRPGVTI